MSKRVTDPNIKTIHELRVKLREQWNKLEEERDAEEPEHTEEIEETIIEVYKISEDHGYEYTLYNSDRNIEYNSFYESSNYLGDGAKTLQEGIKWARTTLKEWSQ